MSEELQSLVQIIELYGRGLEGLGKAIRFSAKGAGGIQTVHLWKRGCCKNLSALQRTKNCRGDSDEKTKREKPCNPCCRRYEKTKTAEFITSVCGVVAAHTLFILLFKRIVYHRCGNDEVEGTDCLVPVTSPEDI